MYSESIQNRLKEVRIDLIDQVDECQDFDENLEPFQPSAFTNVRQQARRCGTECTFIFNNVRDRISNTDVHRFRMEDKSPPLSPATPLLDLTRRKALGHSPIPLATTTLSQPSTPRVPLRQQNRQQLENRVQRSELTDPSAQWTHSGPPQVDQGGTIPNKHPPRGPSPEQRARAVSPSARSPYRYREISPPRHSSSQSQQQSQQLTLIAKEIINSRINANDEFLERRRRSRAMFRNRYSFSASSIEENKTSNSEPAFTMSDGSLNTSPWSSYSSGNSPIERHSSKGSGVGSGGSGYDSLVERKRSQGQTSSHGGGGNSRNGSLRDAPPASAVTKQDSADVIIANATSTQQAQHPPVFSPPTPLPETTTTTPSIKTAPMSPGISEYQPSDSGTSLLLKSPVSPPTTQLPQGEWGRLNTNPATTPLAATLQVPGFGAGVDDGLEVAPQVEIESGLEVVPPSEPELAYTSSDNYYDRKYNNNDNNNAATSSSSSTQWGGGGGNKSTSAAANTGPLSMRNEECPMRHDASFYKFDGFCAGAKAMLRNQTGFKVVKRASVCEIYS